MLRFLVYNFHYFFLFIFLLCFISLSLLSIQSYLLSVFSCKLFSMRFSYSLIIIFIYYFLSFLIISFSLNVFHIHYFLSVCFMLLPSLLLRVLVNATFLLHSCSFCFSRSSSSPFSYTSSSSSCSSS